MQFFDNTLHPSRRAILALILASFIWGVSAPMMKWALIETPVYLLAFIRFFSAALIFLLFKPQLKIKREHWHLLFFAALYGITIHIPLFFFGLRMTSSINAGIIGLSTPVLIAIAAGIFLKEKITRNLLLAAVLGTIGSIIIIFEPLRTDGFSLSVIGNLILVLSLLYGVGFDIMCKKLYKHYNSFTVTFYSFLIGSLLILPFAIQQTLRLPSIGELITSPNFYLGVPFGILVTSVLGYGLWQWGLSKLPASRVGFFIYLDPIPTAIVAYFLLGEVVTPAIIAGGAFIVAALYFAESKHPLHHLFHLFQKQETEYPHIKKSRN